MGGHVFLEYMSFRMTCLMGAYILREVMLCRRKYLIGGVGGGGGHVLVECMPSRWHILQDDVFYWKTCLTGGHILQ